MGKLIDFAYNIFFANKVTNTDKTQNDFIEENSAQEQSSHKTFAKELKNKAIGSIKDNSSNFLKLNLPVSFVIDSINSARFYGFIDEFNEDSSNFPVSIIDDGEHQYICCSPSAFKRILHLYYLQFPDTPLILKGIYHGEPMNGKKIDIKEEPFYAQFFEYVDVNIQKDIEEDFEQDL